MNDPKDIVVSIENVNEEKEEKEVNQAVEQPIEENNENEAQAEETRLDNLVFHLYENFGKRFYKRTLKEIDALIQNKYFQGYSRAWKIYILKIRGLLKIIKKKIEKYLIHHIEKTKLKHHINNIKKYINQIPLELNYFIENFTDENTINEGDKIDYLIRCYFEYIYLYSFFNLKIGNVIEAITYLSFILRLNKETQYIVKAERTVSHIEKCFIFLSHMFIYNEDFYSAIDYLNLTMEMCLKHIIFETKDCNDGIFMGDKNKLVGVIKQNNLGLNKNKYENEVENNYGDKKIKRVVTNIIFIYFYRAICYENIGKMKNAIKCYYQCLWFINHFFYESHKNLSILIKNILDKSLEFKTAVDYLEKKINYYDRMQLLLKNQKAQNGPEKEEKKSNNIIIINNSSLAKKYKSLINKLDNLTINEIDTVNKFEIKKNIKDLCQRKREGKDKNIFLSDIRLLNAYLREDFKVMIDKMDKIKSFDMDFSTRDKIQKFLRRLYFEQNQEKIRRKRLSELNSSKKTIRNHIKSRTSILKSDDIISEDGLKKTIIIKKKNILPNKNKNVYSSTFRLTQLTNDRDKFISIRSPKSCKNIRANSAFSENRAFSSGKKKTKRIFSPFSYRSDINSIKSQTIHSLSPSVKKSTFIQRYKKMKLSSANVVNKIEKDNKDLNKFFNKKYIQKRNYIKKLEDRELKFQKCILKLKNTPTTPIQMYNKEVMRQNANQSFQKIMSLFISNPVNWKDNLSHQEIKNILLYDKLESSMIKSLDRSAFNKFKKEENKQKKKKNYSIGQLSLTKKDINNKNANIIKSIDNKLEELKQREMIENKNYQKILIRNRKHLKYRGERSWQNILNEKFRSANVSPISQLEKISFHYNNIFNKNKEKKKSFNKLE